MRLIWMQKKVQVKPTTGMEIRCNCFLMLSYGSLGWCSYLYLFRCIAVWGWHIVKTCYFVVGFWVCHMVRFICNMKGQKNDASTTTPMYCSFCFLYRKKMNEKVNDSNFLKCVVTRSMNFHVSINELTAITQAT